MSEKSSNRNANRASSSKQRRNQKQDRQEGSDDISGYRQKIRDNKKAESNKAKNGCFPKFLVMLVPLLILGTYLILG